MALHITVKKPAEQQAAVLLSTFAESIDRAGQLQKQIADIEEKIAKKTKKEREELAPLAEQLADLMKNLVTGLNEVHEDTDADQELVERGESFEAVVGKKGNQRVIKDAKKLLELMGPDVFWALVKMNLGDCDKYLTPPQLDEVLEKTRTKRPVEIKPLAEAKVAKAA